MYFVIIVGVVVLFISMKLIILIIVASVATIKRKREPKNTSLHMDHQTPSVLLRQESSDTESYTAMLSHNRYLGHEIQVLTPLLKAQDGCIKIAIIL